MRTPETTKSGFLNWRLKAVRRFIRIPGKDVSRNAARNTSAGRVGRRAWEDWLDGQVGGRAAADVSGSDKYTKRSD